LSTSKARSSILDEARRGPALELVHSQISAGDCMRHYNITREWPRWALDVASGDAGES